jgi:uncharacterized protein
MKAATPAGLTQRSVVSNALAAVLLAPIEFYRRYLSGLKSQHTCRFLPCCSEYASDAIKTDGPAVGLAKAVFRVLRCNPLFHGGYHPVTSGKHACQDCE